MKRKIVFWLLETVFLGTFSFAEAQQPTKVRRIGFLGAAFSSSNPARHEALRQGLRALGWVEGKEPYAVVPQVRICAGGGQQ